MLLEWRGVKSSPGLAPAYESGHEGAVNMFWEWNDVNRGTANEIGGTPFPWPPGDVCEGIVGILPYWRTISISI